MGRVISFNKSLLAYCRADGKSVVGIEVVPGTYITVVKVGGISVYLMVVCCISRITPRYERRLCIMILIIHYSIDSPVLSFLAHFNLFQDLM